MFELSSDFYEKVLVKVQRFKKQKQKIQKQFDLLEVRVIGGSSYWQCTVLIHEFQATCLKKRSAIVIREFINTLVTFKVAIQCEVQYPHHNYNKTSQ